MGSAHTQSLLILVIMINKKKKSQWWGGFQPGFVIYSQCERRYPDIKVCNSDASQQIVWEQVVMFSAHSKEQIGNKL